MYEEAPGASFDVFYLPWIRICRTVQSCLNFVLKHTERGHRFFSGWEEEQVSSPDILRLIYQGRFLHGNVTLGGNSRLCNGIECLSHGRIIHYLHAHV